MNNSDDPKIGGASIIPSARRSIHSHDYCPFAFAEVMGHYGLRAKQQGQRKHRINDTTERGTDEVDNILSKPIHSASPPRNTTNYKADRRYSLERDHVNKSREFDLEDEETSCVLSKSLPATLPSRSHCSDYSEEDVPSQYDNVYSGTSYHPANRSTPMANGNTAQRNAAGHTLSLKSILGLLAAVLVAIYMFNKTNIAVQDVYDESRFYNDIQLLGYKYRIDENDVLLMQTGVSTILKKQDTGSFVFVYDSNHLTYNRDEFDTFINDISVTASKYLRVSTILKKQDTGSFVFVYDSNHLKYNRDKFDTFINDISETASKYLRNRSSPVHYTLVESTALRMRDHGELICRFRDDLDQTGVMLVKDVEAVPSDLAMAFHYYCDEYNPLVKQSAIFFTLNLAECSVATDKKSTHAVIEKCLAQKWTSVPADSIGPLLTRVVSVVIDLTSAF